MHNVNVKYATQAQEAENLREKAAPAGPECPHCGASVDADCEICPHCGKRIVSWCTFCGAPMDWSDAECPECGAPADGIRCQKCGKLSFRAFCPECSAPLTRAAARMVEAAKSDPLMQEANALAEKAAQLDQQNAPKEELIKVTDELNSVFGQMLPPAGSTPQEQRNYFTARKVAVQVRCVTSRRVGWVCNYCGCTHNNPSDCYKPYLGGKWIYEDVVTTKTEFR